jgi:large repetitive protein
MLPLSAAAVTLAAAPAAQAAVTATSARPAGPALVGAGPATTTSTRLAPSAARMHAGRSSLTISAASHRESPAAGLCSVSGGGMESPSSVFYGFETAVQYTFTLSPTSVCLLAPTGTVTVTAGSTTLCTLTLSSSGTEGSGSCNIPTATYLAVGSYEISASYSGDWEYAAADFNDAAGLAVDQQTSTTSLTLSSPGAINGQEQNETLSVRVSPESEGTPTGTVVLSESSTVLCTIPLSSGAGSCSLSSSQLPVGTYSITAAYGGDPEFAASASAAQSLTVGTDGTTTTLSATGTDDPSYGDEQATTFSVSVVAQSGTPTGTVTVSAGGTTLCTITLSSASGSCRPASGAVPAGSYTATAIYNGNATFVPSSGTTPWKVSQASVTVALGYNGSVAYGNESALQFTVNVKPETSGTPTGTVKIEDSSNDMLCTITLSASAGTCSPASGTVVSAGKYQVTAEYAGDGNYLPASSSGTQSFTVGKASTTMELTESSGTATYGDESAVTFTATTSAQYSGTPTGNVTVSYDDGVLCDITLSGGTGTCQANDAAMAPGTWNVAAAYAGDGNFTGVTVSPAASITINPSGSATQLSLSATSVALGSESGEQFTATVTPQYAAAGTPTGTVTVTESGNTLCTITLSGGTASCTMADSALPPGDYQATGTYGGDVDFAGSISAAQPLTVTSAGSATTLVLSSASVTYGAEQAETFTATVSSGSPGTPSGTVTIAESGTTLCTITLPQHPPSGTGSCSLSATTLPGGTYKVTASYGGDSNFGASSSAGSVLTVAKERSTTSMKLSVSTLRLGHENAEHLTVHVVAKYPGAVTGEVSIKAKPAHRFPFQVCVIKLKAGTGSCTLPTRALQPGTYVLIAKYRSTIDILTSDSPKKSLRIRS